MPDGPFDTWTEQEKLDFGRAICEDPTYKDFQRQGRPVTNIEMYAARMWTRHQMYERIDRDGCCGAQMSETGRCPETGHPCPMFLKAKRIEKDTFTTEDKT